MEDNKILAEEIFETAMEYLPRLIDGLEQAAGFFKRKESAKGYQLLSDASDGLTWFNQVVLGLPVILPQGENISDVREKWQPYLEALQSTLDHIEKNDPEAIIKNLDNEIIPFIRMIYGKIGNLKTENPYPQ